MSDAPERQSDDKPEEDSSEEPLVDVSLVELLEPGDELELTDENQLREEYAWGRVAALAGVGAVMLYMGQYHEDMPRVFHTQIMGTPAIGWFRHIFPAVTLTSASELYTDTSAGYAPRPLRWIPGGERIFSGFFRLAMKNEKVTAFAAGFLPSVGWEIHQYTNGSIFGVSDLIAAAGAGALTLAVSTKKIPVRQPRHKPLLKVHNTVNIDS